MQRNSQVRACAPVIVSQYGAKAGPSGHSDRSSGFLPLARRLIAAGTPRALLAGDSVPLSEGLPEIVWRISDLKWSQAAPAPAARLVRAEPPRASVGPATVAEIVFTSGTTGEPKGVLITHGNILANIAAIETEARKYNPYLWPLRPLRFLELLPLSHMFGQALTIFLPPLVRAASVFVSGYNPDEIVMQIRRHRITLVVTVPRLGMLRDRIRVRVPSCASAAPVPLDRDAAVAISRGPPVVLAATRLRRDSGIWPHRDGPNGRLEPSVPAEARHGRQAPRERGHSSGS